MSCFKYIHHKKQNLELKKMKKMFRTSMLILFMTVFFVSAALGQETKTGSDTLVVLWTSGDIEVAEKIVYMYVPAAKSAKWFDEVIFIVWGPSAKLLSENVKLQEKLKKMQEMGIVTEACVACASMYGVGHFKNLSRSRFVFREIF
jgi:hypothetical protein